MRQLVRVLAMSAGAMGFLAGAAYTADQTVLGKSIVVKAKSGPASETRIKGSGKEAGSSDTLVGD